MDLKHLLWCQATILNKLQISSEKEEIGRKWQKSHHKCLKCAVSTGNLSVWILKDRSRWSLDWLKTRWGPSFIITLTAYDASVPRTSSLRHFSFTTWAMSKLFGRITPFSTQPQPLMWLTWQMKKAMNLLFFPASSRKWVSVPWQERVCLQSIVSKTCGLSNLQISTGVEASVFSKTCEKFKTTCSRRNQE